MWTAEDADTARTMRLAGALFREIATALNRTKGAVHTLLMRHPETALMPTVHRSGHTRPVPADYMERKPGMSSTEAVAFWRASNRTISRWNRECGLIGTQVGRPKGPPKPVVIREPKPPRVKAVKAVKPPKPVKIVAPKARRPKVWRNRSLTHGKNIAPVVSLSYAEEAARTLRAYYRPVYDAGKVHGKALDGFYYVGNRKMPVAEMIALANEKERRA